MKISNYFFHTIRETPNDAEIESHKLLIRSGMIRKLAPGIYSYLPLGLKSIRKVESIVREEMNRAGAIEIGMPMVQPEDLWVESGRWGFYGKELLRFKNRSDQSFCLGPTHEEVVSDIARKSIMSYRDLPFNLYQIQTKYRDEIRPRFGLMRGREFIMKDAYSFDIDREKALESYERMFAAYRRVFARCGLEFRWVNADAGNIGGSKTHEFQVLAQSGEDQIMACDSCDHASNIEITRSLETASVAKPIGKTPEKFATPGLKSIADLAKNLKTEAASLVKTLFYWAEGDRYVCVLLRGDDEISETKLKNFLKLSVVPEMAKDADVLRITKAHPGSCGPVGLKIEVYCDQNLKGQADWIVGANEDGHHLRFVNPERDFPVKGWGDFRKAKINDTCPECKKGKLQSFRGIEVGHVFYLGDKYSKSMQVKFLDEKGESKLCEMGCYGIGVTRTMQAAIEQSHDKDGIIWPLPLAPFHVHIALLDVADDSVRSVALRIHDELEKRGVEVLLDDRDERPGVKFKDADLIGMPLRVNVGKKSLDSGNMVEVIERKTKAMTKVDAGQAVEFIMKWIQEKNAAIDAEVLKVK